MGADRQLLWSEVHSVLHHRQWRRELTPRQAVTARTALAAAPIARVEDTRIHQEAWRFADELGWARTYDAEYVALAKILGCRLLTVDMRLWRRTKHLGFIVIPNDL